MNRKTCVSTLTVLSSIMLAAGGCLGLGAGAIIFQNRYALNLAQLATAPEVELTTLAGQNIRLSQFRGKPQIIIFSTTWCDECRQEAPLVKALHTRYSAQAQITVIDLRETAATVKEFMEDVDWNFEVVLDPNGQASDAYYIVAIPTWYFVDAQGNIRGKTIGTPSETELKANLVKIGMTP